MFAASRRWLRRNRTPIAIGVGIVGAGYVVTQFVWSKINDARERMSSDRIAKENLRRRFEQNQEDCTFTVLALLPTATTNILEAMNTEKLSLEIQQMKSAARPATAASPPSIAETNLTDEDGRSIMSESGVHASQITIPAPSAAAGDGTQDGGAAVTAAAQRARRTKRQLWDDLTISSISRAFTLIYTLALLTMLTRVQLNLLGRRSYLSSVISLATVPAQGMISLQNNDDDSTEQASGNDFETNRQYLTFSWWLLHKGWIDLRERVEAAVRQVFGQLSPRDTLTFDRFAELTLAVRKLVEGETPEARRRGGWLRFLLPPADQEEYVMREAGVLDSPPPPTATRTQGADPAEGGAPSLRRLLDETADLIESPAFAHVLTLLLDSGFSTLVDQKLGTATFELPPPPPEGTELPAALRELRASRAVLLPKILSLLTRQAHVIGNGVPNEYLREMETVRDLEGFAAVVYSSNWDALIHEDERAMPPPAPDAGGKGKGKLPEVVRSRGQPGAVPRSEGPSVEESLVVVDPQTSSFESAWGRATEQG